MAVHQCFPRDGTFCGASYDKRVLVSKRKLVMVQFKML